MESNRVLTVTKEVVGDARGFEAIKKAYDWVLANDPDSKMSHVGFDGFAQLIGRGSVKMAAGFSGTPVKSENYNGGWKTIVGAWLNVDGTPSRQPSRRHDQAAAVDKSGSMIVTVTGNEITVKIDTAAVVLNVESGQLTGDILAARKALSVDIKRLVTNATTIDGIVNEPVKTIYFCGSVEGVSEADVHAKCFAIMSGSDKNAKAATIKAMTAGVKSRQTVNAAAGWLKAHMPDPMPIAPAAPAADKK